MIISLINFQSIHLIFNNNTLTWYIPCYNYFFISSKHTRKSLHSTRQLDIFPLFFFMHIPNTSYNSSHDFNCVLTTSWCCSLCLHFSQMGFGMINNSLLRALSFKFPIKKRVQYVRIPFSVVNLLSFLRLSLNLNWSLNEFSINQLT